MLLVGTGPVAHEAARGRDRVIGATTLRAKGATLGEEDTVLLEACPASVRERFGIDRVLGAGAMGAVLEGRVPGVGRRCAVKVLLSPTDSDLRVRFEREARLLARLRHENLVEVLDAGVDDGIPWIAMELIEGRDLLEIGEAGIPPRDLLERVALGVAGALDVLHAEGVIHRDVKPANICLDARGRPVLMDLGLAYSPEQTRMTRTGMISGTLGYMAPEQFDGADAGPAADRYALGVSLFHLATGHLPFESDAVMLMLGKGRGWAAFPSVDGPHAGTPLARAIEALCARDSDARPATREALLAVLAAERVDDPEPAAPRRPGAGLGLALVGAAAVLAGVLASRSGGPAPPGPSGSETPPPAAAAPIVSPARRALVEVCRALGLSPGPEPVMVLEPVCFGGDRAATARALEELLPRRDHAPVRYLAMRAAENLVQHERVLELADEEELEGPVEDYWDGKARLMALTLRLQHRGPAVKGVEAASLERIRGEIRGLEGEFARLREPWGRLLHAELWDVLGRRIHGRPIANIRAFEQSDFLLVPVFPHFESLRPFLRTQVLIQAQRVGAWLGDLGRCRVHRERFESGALEVVRGTGATEEHWTELLREDERQVRESVNISIFVRSMPMETDPTYLPLARTEAGSVPAGTRLRRAVVPDRARKEPLVLTARELDSPEESLLGLGDRARLEGRELGADPTWVRRALLPEIEDLTASLAREALVWPRILRTLAAEVAAEDPAKAAALLARIERARRGAKAYVEERRTWYRGAWAALARDQVALELRTDRGDPGARAARFLGELGGLPGPYTVGEARAAFDLWALLAESCEGAREEALRVGLRVLEGLPGGDARDPAALVDVAVGWLRLWRGDGDPPEGWARLKGEFLAALERVAGHPDAIIWEADPRLAELLRGAGSSAKARPAACTSGPSPGVFLPESVLPPAPEGTASARMARVLAGL